MSKKNLVETVTTQVTMIRVLSPTVFVLRLERNDFKFLPGQYVKLGFPGDFDMREYSVYSGLQDDFLELLIKEVKGGDMSPRFRKLRKGDTVILKGPLGSFIVREKDLNKRFLFVGSGTGIAPLHCFVKSYPGIDYRLIYGVRWSEELYDPESYQPSRLVRCISGEKTEHYHGRVTDYLLRNRVAPDTLCYVCGNSDMICDVYDILGDHGLPPDNLHSEVYF